MPRYMAAFGIFVFEKKFRAISIPNPLHVLEQNLLTAAVIEFRGPAVGMTSNPLSYLQSAVIFQKIRDAGRPE